VRVLVHFRVIFSGYKSERLTGMVVELVLFKVEYDGLLRESGRGLKTTSR
jgi:hypothetical protein